MPSAGPLVLDHGPRPGIERGRGLLTVGNVSRARALGRGFRVLPLRHQLVQPVLRCTRDVLPGGGRAMTECALDLTACGGRARFYLQDSNSTPDDSKARAHVSYFNDLARLLFYKDSLRPLRRAVQQGGGDRP